MHKTLAVGGVEGIGNFQGVARALLEGQRALPQAVLQGFAFQAFHHEKIDAVLAADVIKRADIRMLQRRNRLGLALETLPGFGIIRKTGGQDLDRHSAVEPGVAGAVHLSHSASTERSQDFVRSELRSSGEAHLCGPLYSQTAGRRVADPLVCL